MAEEPNHTSVSTKKSLWKQIETMSGVGQCSQLQNMSSVREQAESANLVHIRSPDTDWDCGSGLRIPMISKI